MSEVTTTMQTSTGNPQTEMIKYGLQINVQKPVVDWSRSTKATIDAAGTDGASLEVKNGNSLITIKGDDYLSHVTLAVDAEADNHISQADIEIIAQARANTSIVLQTHSANTVSHRQNVTLTAKASAHVSLVLIQSLDENSSGFFDITIDAAADATINVISLDSSGAFIQRSIIANLNETGAQCNQQVISLCAEQQHDLYTESNHIARQTKSNILTRAAVLGSSKSVSRSLIKIGKDAFGSEGYEKQEALILSPTAEADAIPNLEIHNHDVKCSHGSTIGQLDEEKLYYLMSRGLNRKQAIAAMIEGYFMPVIKAIPDQATCILVQLCIQKMFSESNNVRNISGDIQ